MRPQVRLLSGAPRKTQTKAAMTAFSPTLRQLRFLVALDAERHFGRAAAAMGVGQSTLSAGISQLERLVGVVLVERSKRSLRFTEIGEAFVVRARALIEATEELTEFATSAAQPLTGPLTWHHSDSRTVPAPAHHRAHSSRV